MQLCIAMVSASWSFCELDRTRLVVLHDLLLLSAESDIAARQVFSGDLVGVLGVGRGRSLVLLLCAKVLLGRGLTCLLLVVASFGRTRAVSQLLVLRDNLGGLG